MNTRRTLTRRVEENDVNEELRFRGGHVPQVEHVPQGVQYDQVPNVEGGNEVPEVYPELTNREVTVALVSLVEVVTTKKICV